MRPVDIEQPTQLIAYLHQRGRIEPAEIPTCRLLEGGVSNRTVLTTRPSGEAWVLKQALEQLRVAAEWHSNPIRIHCEAAGMRALDELLPTGAVPKFLFEDHEHHLLAMEAVAQPHDNWRDLLLEGKISNDLVIQFGELLAFMHRRSRERADFYAPSFANQTFFEELRLEAYYAYSAQTTPAAAAFYAQLIADTRSTHTSLVHGDYSPKNVLVRLGKLVLLDHEVIHWGDPTFDIGFALTHFLSKANHLSTNRTAFAAAARMFFDTYAACGGFANQTADEPRAVRQTLGCLLARIVGRSPLGYLTSDGRTRQRDTALQLIAAPPTTMHTCIDRFIDGVSRNPHAHH